MYKYAMTNDLITLFIDGKEHTITNQAMNFAALAAALISKDEQAVRDNLSEDLCFTKWAAGAFTFDASQQRFSYKDTALPTDINKRICAMAKNQEDPTSLLRFYEKLQNNVSYRSVQQLYSFLSHQGIPITSDGNILAYKGVNADYKDKHTGSFDNSPGNTHEMPRNQISDDPNEACHFGFHVGSEQYAKSFGERVVICSVDPADVVCVPYDANSQKMRVSKYQVIGNYGDTLPSTVIKDTEIPIVSMKQQTESAETPCRYTAEELHAMSVEQLRKIAFHDFNIIGASRIRGGKITLIEMILSIIYSSAH